MTTQTAQVSLTWRLLEQSFRIANCDDHGSTAQLCEAPGEPFLALGDGRVTAIVSTDPASAPNVDPTAPGELLARDSLTTPECRCQPASCRGSARPWTPHRFPSRWPACPETRSCCFRLTWPGVRLPPCTRPESTASPLSDETVARLALPPREDRRPVTCLPATPPGRVRKGSPVASPPTCFQAVEAGQVRLATVTRVGALDTASNERSREVRTKSCAVAPEQDE